MYKHANGICYYYENLTNNLKLNETLGFKPVGLKIVGVKEGQTQVVFSIKPGETKFVELVPTQKQWKTASGVSFQLEYV